MDAPAATSFQVPSETSGSDSEGEEEEQAQQAEAPQQAAQPAAASQPTEAADSTNGAASSAPTGGATGGGNGVGRQVVTLQNGTLTVNADGSVSISGPDAAKVLEALAAVGVLPAGSSSSGAAAPAVPVRETSEVEYLTGAH